MIFVNISAYKFIELQNLTLLQQQLKSHCLNAGVKGTILLSNEGININLAGAEISINDFIKTLHAHSLFSDITFKISLSEKSPFKRLYVKIKPEIITTGIPDLKAMLDEEYRLSPQQLKQWLDKQKDFILLDTRNNYETQVGTFTKALTLDIEEFSEFSTKIKDLPSETKNKPVVMFCTGGVRCEKALPQMKAAGFSQVYQLDGGILNYFAECADAHYQGECFVFDNRGSVNPSAIIYPTAEVS
jgi:predicted sulfurtransferase